MQLPILLPIQASQLASERGEAVTFISSITGSVWTVQPANKPVQVASRSEAPAHVARPIADRVVVEDDGDVLWAV